MGSIRDRLADFLSRKTESMFRGSSSAVVGGKFIMMEDNPKEYIEKALVYNPDVASVIDYITKVALRVPWILKSGDTVIEDHPIYDIWSKGNGISRGKHIWGTAIKQRLAAGNAYIYGGSPENGVNEGKITEFSNLYYDMMIEKGNAMNPILSYKNNKTLEVYPAEKVMHWKSENPEGDGYFGTSPLKAGRLVLQQSNDSYLANAKSLQNLGARGILTRKDLNQAGKENAIKLQKDFENKLSGADKFGKLVIAGGEYDYINFALSPADLQLLDAQLRSRQAICNIYGFPSELLNDKDASTYNNMRSMMRKLYTDIEIPLLEDLADIVHEFWVKSWGEKLSWRPDWSKIEELQASKKELVEWLSACWWMSAERKAEIMQEQTELEGYYIPANLVPEGLQDTEVNEVLKAYGIE